MAASSFRGMVVTTVFPGAFGALEFARRIMLQVYVYNLKFHIKPANSPLSMAKKCLISDDKSRCCLPSDSPNGKAQSIKTHPQSCLKNDLFCKHYEIQRYQSGLRRSVSSFSIIKPCESRSAPVACLRKSCISRSSYRRLVACVRRW